MPKPTLLVSKHLQALKRTRKLVEAMLVQLENECRRDDTQETKITSYWWGEKETRLSALMKLSQLLIKIVAAESDTKTRWEKLHNQHMAEQLGVIQWSHQELTLFEQFIEQQRAMLIKESVE